MTKVHTSYEKNVLKIPIFCGCITRFCCQCVSPVTNQKSKKEERRYEEKKTAYVGLLTSIHDAAIRASDENSKAYALWKAKCQIFGSDKAVRFSQVLSQFELMV
ncbi:hypothetical protein PsalMR5_04605 (plasmid) [Piscirickettsia salmonis]|uniref:hypothetical protein n=1 Tax=Piscirickettsia salmonis TaxID=1238 RepID=UPI0018ACDDDC|nr:hypothetical protein [Piscirickettsia salmonis]QGP57148.1 hypothetical protein PsalSR1_04637 [Piscirickettsia salmonis]QGP61922.1 hypothetical protein PsalBI1_04564 [Piscirickettsia salmonis]QGP66680.1 hypothetical protein PsalMR5_04605 [Piscirickettsia salmonis]